MPSALAGDGTSFLWQATGPTGEGSHPDRHKSVCIHPCFDATRVGVHLKWDLPGILVAAVTVSPLVSGRWWRVIDHGKAGEGRVTRDRVSLSTRRNHEDSDPSITHLGSEWVLYVGQRVDALASNARWRGVMWSMTTKGGGQSMICTMVWTR